MGDLVRRTLQKKPHLRVVQHEHEKLLTFIFKLEGNLPRALRKENPGVYSYLFEPREKKHWTNILLKAYQSRSASGKSVRLSLRFWLNQLLRNAIDTLSRNATSQGKPCDSNIKKEVELLKTFLSKKRGRHGHPRRRERDAIRFAKRYEELLPQTNMLKTFVKSRKEQDDETLGRNAEKELRFQWLSHVTKGEALQHLPTINQNSETKSSTLKGKWAAWQLSVGIIYCEEKAPNRRTLGPNTIYYKYIRRGKQLLKKSSPATKRAPNPR